MKNQMKNQMKNLILIFSSLFVFGLAQATTRTISRSLNNCRTADGTTGTRGWRVDASPFANDRGAAITRNGRVNFSLTANSIELDFHIEQQDLHRTGLVVSIEAEDLNLGFNDFASTSRDNEGRINRLDFRNVRSRPGQEILSRVSVLENRITIIQEINGGPHNEGGSRRMYTCDIATALSPQRFFNEKMILEERAFGIASPSSTQSTEARGRRANN